MSRTTRSTTSLGRVIGEVPEAQRPVLRDLAEERPDVAAGDVGEVLAPLVAGQRARRPHGAEQRAAQRARARARLEHPHAGADVAEADDLGGVLRIDDLRAARHRQHEVGQQRPERQVPGVGGRHDDGALGRADQVVVLDRPAVRVELLARLEDDGVQPPLRIGELHAVADHERPFDRLPRGLDRRRLGQGDGCEVGGLSASSCWVSTCDEGTDGADVTPVPCCGAGTRNCRRGDLASDP